MKYRSYFEAAITASRELNILKKETIAHTLLDVAEALVRNTDKILEANKKDLDLMDKADPKYDRLRLSPDRIRDIAADMSKVANLESPIGQLIDGHQAENGMQISRLRVPLGVVGVIYESRPNVTADVFALCFKTGNVAVLKGGSDATQSNAAIAEVIQKVLQQFGINKNVLTLLPPERAATESLLNARGLVDVLIPRGSQALIDYVRLNSKIPVIETGAGIVHTYFDLDGDLEKGKGIVLNAKTRRVSVCNALDCLLIHKDRLEDLPSLVIALSGSKVLIHADEASYAVLKGNYPGDLLKPAGAESFGTEFLSHQLAIKTVSNLEEALQHIAKYSSKHSEAIISEHAANVETFLNQVDAAAVYANASTAFTDGAQFGLGAEIGISTQKLHARGPMGLTELTSYKWVIRGNGQTRSA
ncbi:glutamate-5-semialdehyde dehydrogenase [Pedobacter sp. SAFR-022]|uniref:glutamate-5-semialdehyde dehydrogenase n=1 Tax=Pedobacter sp. SAFR-022 TaxID=3436861 RepID=UPI003F7FE40A